MPGRDHHSRVSPARELGDDFDALLRGLQAGEAWAFERVFRALSPVVAGYLRLQGASEPDDLTSEVFLGVFRNMASFQGDAAKFRSWVFTIAHRRLTDERRRRGRGLPVAPEPVGAEHADRSGGDAEVDALARLGEQRVRAMCGRLLPDQRDVLLLRVMADLTIEQIAAALGRSVGATKQLQRRGLIALRRELEREDVPL